jgi:hypothetical protein
MPSIVGTRIEQASRPKRRHSQLEALVATRREAGGDRTHEFDRCVLLGEGVERGIKRRR